MTKFSAWEQLNLAAILVILGFPVLLLLEITITRQLHPALVLINLAAASLFFLIFIYQRSSAKEGLDRIPVFPLLCIFFLQLIIITAIFSAYLALSDVDPYHWIKEYNQNFNTGPLNKLPQRSLFHTLIYTLDQIPGIRAEIIFKYIIPLLSLLCLIPAWLVARRFRRPTHQILWLLVPLLSPSLIIHSQMGTPQAVLLVLTIFFVFLLIYSRLTQNRFWHYLAGAIMLLAIPIHGLALLMFTSWLVATAWRHSKHNYILLLLLPIAILAAPYLKAYLPQVFSDIHLNLSFPATFTTIDNVPNGWPGLTGLIQYYAFYLGLVVPVILLINIFLFFKHAGYRRQITQLIDNSSTLTLVIMFAGFFSIAEVLPRFFNIVILPDRAWLFADLAATVFFLPLFQYRSDKNKFLSFLLILFFIINIGGALYINNLKKNLLPDYAVNAALWLNSNLPANSAVMLNRKPEYLDLYTARISLIQLPDDFFCLGSDDIVAFSQQEPTLYLLFLKPNTSSPYLQRPWHEPLDTQCSKPGPGNELGRFQQIYNDGGQAIIWKIL
ncbi:MAG: hypothetical protein ABIH36_01545 [bacterium]